MAKRILTITFFALLFLPLIAGTWSAARRGLSNDLGVGLLASPQARARAANELLDVPFLSRAAFATQNLVQYFVFGHLDAPRVISGADGWQFLKEQFLDRGCEDPTDMHVATANSIATTQAIAQLVGSRVVVSISPDKSIVHPEQLGARTRAFAGCSLASSLAFHETLARLAPEVIDHFDVLRRDATDPPLYWALDTHWNRVGYVLAMAQLREALAPERAVPRPSGILATEGVETAAGDLARIGLGITLKSDGPGRVRDLEDAVFGSPIPLSGSVLVVHDSFYNRYPETSDLFGPDAVVVNVNMATGDSNLTAEPPDLIVLNSVERAIQQRFADAWSLRGQVLSGLWSHYVDLTDDACGDVPNERSDATNHIVAIPTNLGHPHSREGVEVVLPPVAPQADRICLVVDLGPGTARSYWVWLPPLAGQRGALVLEPGRSLDVVPDASNTIRLLLPADLQDRRLLLAPVTGEPPTTPINAWAFAAHAGDARQIP